MATAKKVTTKTRATKGDSSKPLPSSKKTSFSPAMREYAELPDITSEEAEAVCIEVLRDVYCETIRYYLDRKEGKDGVGKSTKEEQEQIEGLLKSFEQVIIWFDQTDKWLNDLHSGKLQVNPEDK